VKRIAHPPRIRARRRPAAGCRSAPPATSYDVVVLARPGEEGQAREDLARARETCRALQGVLSEWKPDSEVSLANARAGREEVRLSPLLRRLLAGALHVARATGGTFDPAWAPLGALWDEAERRGRDHSSFEVGRGR
jgi:thiamine biosynthesis lipoprotein ApbE